MKRKFDLRLPDWSVPFYLLAGCIAAYGLLIPWLGFYSDDWIFAWSGQVMGPAGIHRYFDTIRPFWGWLYLLTQPWIGASPIFAQVTALLARWMSSVGLWLLLRSLWPENRRLALSAAALFALYPGLTIQSISLVNAHLFIVFDFLLFSFWLSVKAIQAHRHAWLYHAGALLLSTANLLMLEYYFLLELMRPIVLWLALYGQTTDVRKSIRRAVQNWLPYLVLFLGVIIWRVFFFSDQQAVHPIVFFNQLRADPLQAILDIILAFFHNIRVALVDGIAAAFSLPQAEVIGSSAVKLYILEVITGVIFSFLFLFGIKKENGRKTANWQSIMLGVLCLALAGWPFLLTDLIPDASSFFSRFLIPYILGVALIIPALILYLPRTVAFGILAVLLGFSMGHQSAITAFHRQDWKMQQRFYWQVSWRMPALQEGAILVSNDFPDWVGGETAISAALNWFYAPENSSDQVSYAWLYASEHPELAAGTLPPTLDYLSGTFDTTGRPYTLVYYDNRCLRVLTPANIFESPGLHERVQGTLLNSTSSVILPAAGDGSQVVLPTHLAGTEPAHDWCYYYLRMDLSRQNGDWETVRELGEEALTALGDPVEDLWMTFPLIQAYAQSGDWEHVTERFSAAIAQEEARPDAFNRDRYRAFWDALEATTPPSVDRDATGAALMELLGDQ